MASDTTVSRLMGLIAIEEKVNRRHLAWGGEKDGSYWLGRSEQLEALCNFLGEPFNSEYERLVKSQSWLKT